MGSPHAVLFSMDGPGHINPMLELSRRLEQLGFTITFILTGATLANRLPSLLQEQQRSRMSFVGIPDGRPASGFSSVEELCEAVNRMQQPVEDMVAGLDPPATLLISDTFIGWMQDVADKFEIPRVGFWTASAACDIVCFHIPTLISKGYIPVRADMEDTSLITFLPGLPPLRRTDLPLSFYDENASINFIARGSERNPEASCILANTLMELEPDAVTAMQQRFNYLPVGPLMPAALFEDEPLSRESLSTDEDLSCMEWLDMQSPCSVLYIAFGSVAVLSAAQVESIAEGLEASKQAFLWVIRPNFVVDPPDGFHQAILERTKALKGRIVAWAPQIHVLRHSSVAGFVTHCGWNSLMEGICSGVPMLAWPCTSEQNMNAKFMTEQWKIALKVNDEVGGAAVDGDVIEKLVTAVMNGEEARDLKAKVLELRDAIRKAVKAGGSSHRNLLAFAASMKNPKKP